jgi:hypothetical protein
MQYSCADPTFASPAKEVIPMPYSADISRNDPGCFLFLIDQSRSMKEALGGQPGLRKMDGAADAVNRILDAISQRCSQGMEVRDYFHVGIITYTTDIRGNPDVRSTLPGTSPKEPFLTISQVVETAEVEERQVKESDGAGGVVDVTRKFPVWLRPVAGYGTPMCEALSLASEALHDWIADHPNCYPPMVISVTDGDATDGDPVPLAEEIMAMGTDDGNVLVYNAHLSEMSAMPVQYPSDDSEVPPDEYAAQMFRMSSELPDPVVDLAAGMGLPVTQGSRGYVYNADMVALVQFLDIGTRAASDLH